VPRCCARLLTSVLFRLAIAPQEQAAQTTSSASGIQALQRGFAPARLNASVATELTADDNWATAGRQERDSTESNASPRRRVAGSLRQRIVCISCMLHLKLARFERDRWDNLITRKERQKPRRRGRGPQRGMDAT